MTSEQFTQPEQANTTNYVSINDEFHDWLTLALIPQLGAATFAKLIKHFNNPSNTLRQNFSTLSQLTNNKIATAISQQTSANAVEQSYIWLKESPCRYIITLTDPRYPTLLKQIENPPPILYAYGNIALLQNNNKLAIVGTRHPTPQGAITAHKFAHTLAQRLTIVSGMALGIDRQAHLGALSAPNSTIGVIGTGIDLIYPKANSDIFSKVISQGLLLSEFALKTPPLVVNFPRRNRIIAGLSKGCLVIESDIDGGSMITANYAVEMGREVLAIPSSINNIVARGCHKLIKTGAKLVENINDILEEIFLEPALYNEAAADANINNANNIKINKFDKCNSKIDKTSTADLFNNLQDSNQQNERINDTQRQAKNITSITQSILAAMGFEPIEIDKICLNAQMNFDQICAVLLELELNGYIVNCGNGKYQRIIT